MKRLRLLLAGISFLAVSLFPGLANADVNDFVIISFKSEQTLTRNDPQGELHIVEHISLKYSDFNHGILRAIPDRYKNHSLQLKVNSVSSPSHAPSEFTTYSSNGNTVLKIGNPDRLVTGKQSYVIDYTLRNVISFYQDHDELFWDVNGDQWGQPFESVDVTLHLPAGLMQSKQPLCYTGSYASGLHDCIASTDNRTIAVSTTKPLSQYSTLTYVAGFEKNYFRPSKWYETAWEYNHAILGITIPILAITGTSFVFWLRFGRDPKGRGVIIPQYEPPEGIKPLAAGDLIDFKLDNKDVTATIVDLAVRGYIKIVETKKDRPLIKDKLTYKLELRNDNFEKLDEQEQLTLNALFPTKKTGEICDLTESKNKLYETAAQLSENVKEMLQTSGYFYKSRISGRSLGKWLAFIAAAVLFCLLTYSVLGIWLMIGIMAAFFASIPFWAAMNARTAKGVAAKEHILGLKMYLETAEKARFEKLQSPDASYAENHAAPVKTVELFEKLLPYAVALGVEKQWAKQFDSLYTQPPDWYSGNWSSFNATYLASSINSGVGSSLNAAFSAPSSSSSSGFGGGGAGGGGGGGGGGGW